MKPVSQCRTEFELHLWSLRDRQHLTLRQLDELSGAPYSMISCLEHGDRAVGGDVAANLATALGLCGEERETFLLMAAATRRKDRLVGYARTLAPELVNFVPRVLARFGVNLEAVDACEVRLHVDRERPEMLPKLPSAFDQVNKAVAGEQVGDFLVIDAGGKRLVCALLVVPTT
jgi:hypothetical protein